MTFANKTGYGILFDCDGTLMNSLGRAVESFNDALAKIGEPPCAAETIKQYFGGAADRIFQRILNDQTKAARAFEHYLEDQVQQAARTKPHAGVRELLDLLERKQVPLGLVTGRHARDLEILLRPHDLTRCFRVIVTDDQLARSKPAPDGILLAVKEMGLDPSRVIYVGDSTFDVRTARAAGSPAVAALWDPFATPEALLAEEPEFVARTPEDVWLHFQTMIGSGSSKV